VTIGHIKVVEHIICFWSYHFHFQNLWYYWATLTHVNPPHLHIPKNFKTLYFHNFSKFSKLKIVFGGAKAIPMSDWRRSSNLETISMEDKLYIARSIFMCHTMDPNNVRHFLGHHWSGNSKSNLLKCGGTISSWTHKMLGNLILRQTTMHH
jgi:hypothetical protein